MPVRSQPYGDFGRIHNKHASWGAVHLWQADLWSAPSGAEARTSPSVYSFDEFSLGAVACGILIRRLIGLATPKLRTSTLLVRTPASLLTPPRSRWLGTHCHPAEPQTTKSSAGSKRQRTGTRRRQRASYLFERHSRSRDGNRQGGEGLNSHCQPLRGRIMPTKPRSSKREPAEGSRKTTENELQRQQRQQASTAPRPPRAGDEAPPGTPGTGEDVCPMCRGTGRVGSRSCSDCEGTGRVIKGIGGA